MYFVTPPYLFKRVYHKALWRIPTDEKIIYLTFDDGPVPEITSWVLDMLKQYNAKATFFCVGNNVKIYPDLFQQILSEKHSVGNHTYNHINGWKTSTKRYLANIDQCNAIIDSKLFRPPYGKMQLAQYSWLHAQYVIVMWDVLSGDFDKKTSEEDCLQHVLKNTKAGSIVVFHDNSKARKNLYYALPKTLDYFTNKGFTFDKI